MFKKRKAHEVADTFKKIQSLQPKSVRYFKPPPVYVIFVTKRMEAIKYANYGYNNSKCGILRQKMSIILVTKITYTI